MPLRLRLWLIGVPVLTAVALVLAANGPGAGDTCRSKGIMTAAAREGICQRGMNLFGGGVTFNVVDAGTTLSMPGYQAQLVASSVSPIGVEGPNATPALYPNHQGLLVSFEVQVTNDGSAPLRLPVNQTIAVVVPDAAGSARASVWSPPTYLTAGPVPQLNAVPAAAVGGSELGWVSFILPPSVEPRVHARLARLDLYPADGNHDYVGQIRLWKAANAYGAAALRFTSAPPAPL